jgi:hypothetical protein
MNFYDEAIEQVKKLWNGNELTYPKHTIKVLERAKRVEELMLIYKQYYNGYLSPADQKRRQDLEKELEEERK